MTADDALRALNRGMVAFDLALGTSTLLQPASTLRLLGHDFPSEDAEHLFRRNAPVWLTFAAAHLTAARRDRREDWHALAWLRATELLTDVLWARSPAVPAARSKAALVGAGVANAAMSLGFAHLAGRSRGSRRRR